MHSAYDSATSFASECAREVKMFLLKTEFEISEFFGVDACVEKVHGHMQFSLSEVQGFLNYGHGNKQTIFGNNGEVLFDISSAGLLKNKICYVLACSAAKVLGKEIVGNGGICFLGFNEDFTYSTSHENLFKVCVNSGIKAMIFEKMTIGEAYERMRETFDQTIVKVVSTAGIYNWLVTVFLREDKNCLELIGDSNASLR